MPVPRRKFNAFRIGRYLNAAHVERGTNKRTIMEVICLILLESIGSAGEN